MRKMERAEQKKKIKQAEQELRYTGKRRKKHNGTPCWLLIVMLILDLTLIFVAGRCMYHFFHRQEAVQAASGTEISESLQEQNANGRINWKEDEGTPVKEMQNMALGADEIEECRVLYEKNTDLLVLVNKECALSETYELPLKVLENKRVRVADIMYADLKEMLRDASDYGYAYALVSGFRDAEYQQDLIQKDVRKYMEQQNLTREEALVKTYEQVMPAEHSEHETGLAIDITASGNTALDVSQASEPGIMWLHENCWRYGFILRYPQDKEEITQISYEPWHFRYVGRDAAKFLYEHNLTLEEFHECL